ncbi:MAG: hydantoinase/oxoprolinase N-terminal domain-containing protein [Amaricoccus sp.]
MSATNTDLVLDRRLDHAEASRSASSTNTAGRRRSAAEVETIVHGTTTATNITIEHNGSECGMLTTEGFRDILHIGRHKRPYNFSLHFDVPWQSQPLVKRRNRIAIPERILPPTGAVATPLDEAAVRAACAVFRRRGIESVVIGFMFAFLNDAHERRARGKSGALRFSGVGDLGCSRHRRGRTHRTACTVMILYSGGLFFLIGPYAALLYFVGESFPTAIRATGARWSPPWGQSARFLPVWVLLIS